MYHGVGVTTLADRKPLKGLFIRFNAAIDGEA